MNARHIHMILAVALATLLIAAIAMPRLIGRCDGSLQFHNEESDFSGTCEWIQPI